MQEQYNNSIIFYTTDLVKDGDTWVICDKDDLNTGLKEIIKHHQYIPSGIKHDRYRITRIIFQKEGTNIILTMDCNRKSIKDIDYKDVLKICKTHDIEFKNQSFGSLVQDIKRKFFDKQHKRIRFSKAKREELYMKFEKKCNCCEKQLQLKQTHIDHVIPLAGGGTNNIENLQILCNECRFEKTQQEREPRIR